MSGLKMIGDMSELFAPIPEDRLAVLLDECGARAAEIKEVSQTAKTLLARVGGYFIEGNWDTTRSFAPNMLELLGEDNALKALYAHYWQKAMDLTDVLDHMPEKRRTEWREFIRTRETPPFTEDFVYPTLRDLVMQREKFLAERVEGLFYALSREHVTNKPEGFSTRMILPYVLDDFGVTHYMSGHIHDLRCLVAKFMGQDTPDYNGNRPLIQTLYRETGVWHSVDGGALEIKTFKKGTAHLKVHEDIAWRLNTILAYLHPMAIPSEFRKPPAKKPKVTLTSDLVPFPVVALLDGMGRVSPLGEGAFSMHLPSSEDKMIRAQAADIMKLIGGVQMDRHAFLFDYNPESVIREITVSRLVPNKKTHQFYPTPKGLASFVRQEAELAGHHTVLEPSAGLGALIEGLDPEKVTAIEVSSLFGHALRRRGFKVTNADFLAWSDANRGQMFDRIVMNPPFHSGQARAHVEHAVRHLAPGGILVAVVPEGFSPGDMNGCLYTVTEPAAGLFDGTGVSVRVIKVMPSRAAPARDLLGEPLAEACNA